MLAVRTHFDGKKIRLPENARHLPPCDVIVLFEESDSSVDDDWLRAQQEALSQAWDDEEDSVYDRE